MGYSQDELFLTGKEHFDEIIMPKLRRISAEAAENMLAFVEGSVAYGLCDEHSDVDVDYHIDARLDDALSSRIRDVFTSETYWRGSIRVSYGFGGSFWKIDSILRNDMEAFWSDFNPYALNNLKRAMAVWDPKGLMPAIRERIGRYPGEVFKKVVRGLWITVNDSGEYNVAEALKRGKAAEARIYFHRALEAALRLAYVLNDEYYPPTKWLSAGLSGLENDFGTRSALAAIEGSAEFRDGYSSFLELRARLKAFMLDRGAIEKESVEDYSAIFRKPFFVFNAF